NLIGICEVNPGNKDDCSLLESRMLPDYVGQFKSIKLRHTHVHEHNRDVILQQDIECFTGRSCLDQIFAQVREDDLVAQEFGRLIIDHQDVDLSVCVHQKTLQALCRAQLAM